MTLSPNDRWLIVAAVAAVGVVIAFLLIAWGNATGRVDSHQPPRVTSGW